MSQKRQIPNRVTSDTELTYWCNNNIPQFRGVYDRTKFKQLYGKMKPGDSIILNADPEYKNGGTHWVAFRISSEAPICYFKDSFGSPPFQEIVDTVKDRAIIYGNDIDQGIKEENCGKRAAEFLKKMYDASAKHREIEMFEQLEC